MLNARFLWISSVSWTLNSSVTWTLNFKCELNIEFKCELNIEFQVWAERWIQVWAERWIQVWAERWIKVWAEHWIQVWAEHWIQESYGVFLEGWKQKGFKSYWIKRLIETFSILPLMFTILETTKQNHPWNFYTSKNKDLKLWRFFTSLL